MRVTLIMYFAQLGLLLSAATEPYALPRITGVRIDGSAEDWADHGLRIAHLVPDSPEPPNLSRSHARARYAWDEQGLLVLVEVTDSTPCEASRASGAYLFDGVELFLAPTPQRRENLQLVISPGRIARARAAYVYDNRAEAQQSLPKDAEWAAQATESGYIVEARLPWATVGVRAAPGVIVGSRLFVDDHDGIGRRNRFSWAPEQVPFFSLQLAEEGTPATTLNRSIAALVLDVSARCARLNLVTEAAATAVPWRVQRDGREVASLMPEDYGTGAAASLAIPSHDFAGNWTVAGPNGESITLRNRLAALAAEAIITANRGWRVEPTQKLALAFASFRYSEYVFSGSRFPQADFASAAEVRRLLNAQPVVTTTWLNAHGQRVERAEAPGLYGARAEIDLPGRATPLVLEHIFFRMPDGATVPPDDSETHARVLGFSLNGADATPSQAARVAERWWHRVRRAQGWAQALRYKLHVPENSTDGPRALLVLLHGTGGDREEFAERFFAQVVRPRNDPDFIALYPMSPSSWRGPGIAELIDEVMQKHPVDPNRVYLMGFSMGGIGTWEVALDQPDRFAAIAPIGGRMSTPVDAARLRSIPIWAINGAEDPSTTPEEAAMIVEAVRATGGSARLTLIPGASHGESEYLGYLYPGLLDWLLHQRRDSSATTCSRRIYP